MTMDARDEALQRSCPLIAAPRYGALPAMTNGERVIVARNGVFVQVKRDWLDGIERIGEVDAALPLPYGSIAPRLRFTFGPIPIPLIEAFIAAGRIGLPNEIAGGLIYSARHGVLRLALYEAIESSGSGIAYRMPTLANDESIAIDLHTHGVLPAGWSAIDDADDRSVKVAGVFGHLDRPRPSAAFRLVINGLYRALPHPWQQQASELDAPPAWPTLRAWGWVVGE